MYPQAPGLSGVPEASVSTPEDHNTSTGWQPPPVPPGTVLGKPSKAERFGLDEAKFTQVLHDY